MKKQNSFEMVNFSYSAIGGLYSNKIEEGKWKNFGLWDKLIRSYKNKADTIETNNNMLVQLKMINNNLLNVKLIDNNREISAFNLRGKIDGEYFSVRRKFFLLPVPAFLFYLETKNLIGNSKTGDLIVMHGHERGAWVLFCTGNVGGISKNSFIKIKQ